MERRLLLAAIGCIPLVAQSTSSSDVISQRSAEQDSTGHRRQVGIALGGGSIHGMAHVGVLKAFAEKGLQFQYIADTSAGAIVGVLAAAQTTA